MAKRSKKNERQADLNDVTPAADPAMKHAGRTQHPDPGGFNTSPVPIGELGRLPTNSTPQSPRRKRVAGRSMSFSVKLRADTLEYIYAIANGRNVPLAQVIEELVEVHAHQQVATAK